MRGSFEKSIHKWGRGCLSKMPIATLEKAERKAKEVTKKYGVEQHPYYCTYCQKFHLTTRPPHLQFKGTSA